MALIENNNVVQASERGWETLPSGNLLSAAETAGFEVIITVDKNFSFQQHLANRQISLITLNPILSRLPDLVPLLPELNRMLEVTEPGSMHMIYPEP